MTPRCGEIQIHESRVACDVRLRLRADSIHGIHDQPWRVGYTRNPITSIVPTSHPYPRTVAYKSPEAFDDEFTPASEVYSFGIVAWEVITGKLPWQDTKTGGAYSQVSPHKTRLRDLPL